MKALITVFIVVLSMSCYAQPTLKSNENYDKIGSDSSTRFNAGSNIDIPKLNNRLINDLELLGKIWGFLKYHHPEIGKGNYNWDYELFSILPTYINNKDSSKRDQILVNWIDKYGSIPKCNECKETTPDAFLKPDHSWIEKSKIGSQLKEKLTYIYQNRYQGKHFYIQNSINVGNPQFLNENPYSNMPYPDEGYRLLALYRYWNMIYYFFPYKHLMDKDWNNVLKEYIPAFINAKDELAYEQAVVKIIGDIQDTHANLWEGNNKIQEWKGRFYPPFRVEFVQGKLVVTDYYNPELKKEVGLEIGNVITHIYGVQVKDMVKRLKG